MNELIKPSRRLFVAGLASLIAAPAIVRAASLMPVRSPPVLDGVLYRLGDPVVFGTVTSIETDGVFIPVGVCTGLTIAMEGQFFKSQVVVKDFADRLLIVDLPWRT